MNERFIMFLLYEYNYVFRCDKCKIFLIISSTILVLFGMSNYKNENPDWLLTNRDFQILAGLNPPEQDQMFTLAITITQQSKKSREKEIYFHISTY